MMSSLLFVRYGTVPEVAKFVHRLPKPPRRGDAVVVRTHRGLQLGQVLEAAPSASDAAIDEMDFEIVRTATDEDETAARQLNSRCEGEFFEWCRRIVLWNLELELVDLERTLDEEKVILYVLADRGPATTQLALQAAAEGLGLIEVQPVSAQGLVAVESSGGGGCGTGGCGCSH